MDKNDEITWEMLEKVMDGVKTWQPWQPPPMPAGHIKRIKEKIGNWEALRIMYPYHAAAIDKGEL